MYRACIIDTLEDEERIVEVKAPFQSWTTFAWHDGYLACDCNRGALFQGRDSTNLPCGEGRYRVPWIEHNGLRIEIDA